MIKAIVKDIHGNITHQATRESMSEAQAWVESESANGSFGKPGWMEYIPGVHDAHGNVLAEPQEIHHPADFVIEYEDISAQVADEQADLEKMSDEEFGRYIIRLIARINSAGNVTDEQMDLILGDAQYSSIILALLTTSITTARRKIAALGPTLYPQPLVDQIIGKIDDYLAAKGQGVS